LLHRGKRGRGSLRDIGAQRHRVEGRGIKSVSGAHAYDAPDIDGELPQ